MFPVRAFARRRATLFGDFCQKSSSLLHSGAENRASGCAPGSRRRKSPDHVLAPDPGGAPASRIAPANVVSSNFSGRNRRKGLHGTGAEPYRGAFLPGIAVSGCTATTLGASIGGRPRPQNPRRLRGCSLISTSTAHVHAPFWLAASSKPPS